MMALMFFSIKPDETGSQPLLWKQILHNFAHIPAYLVLTFLLWKSFLKNKLLICVIAAFLYGLLNECFQMFVPYRTASLMDLILNGIGIMLAVIIIERFFSKKES